MLGFPSNRTVPPDEGGTGSKGKLFGLVIGMGKKVMQSLKINLAGGSAPGVGDDSTQGYTIGSQWFTASGMYVCLDATAGAAVWALASSSGGTLAGYSGRVAASTSSMTNTIANVHTTLTGVIVVTIETPDGAIYTANIMNRVNATSFDVVLSALPSVVNSVFINWLQIA